MSVVFPLVSHHVFTHVLDFNRFAFARDNAQMVIAHAQSLWAAHGESRSIWQLIPIACVVAFVVGHVFLRKMMDVFKFTS